MASKLRFGIFVAPIHPAGENPTTLLEHDLELIQTADRLGFHEAWIGEHHSAGAEIIGAPEIMCAAALERTRHIRIGAGVVSAPYHNPLWVAERAVHLDHLYRGRFILGLGAGALPTDMDMIGLNPVRAREIFPESVDIIMRLLHGETVTFQNERWDLREATLHYGPYSQPNMEIAIAAVQTPSGPMVAGQHGLSLLSIGAATPGADFLGMHWGVMESQAAKFGTTVDRSGWRLNSFMHIAETREQAYADVAHGIVRFFDYATNVSPFALKALGDEVFGDDGKPKEHDAQALVRMANESGFAIIGTPDDAIQAIGKLWDDTGGFGTMLQFVTDWAPPAAKTRSLELFARHVIPQFTGSGDGPIASEARARKNHDELVDTSNKALATINARYDSSVVVSH